jgi:DNA-binding NarL/FixJ family response regulator
MLARVSSPKRREFPSAPPVAWRLAVISRDPSLAGRATHALERDGLMVTLEAVGPDLPSVQHAGKLPSLLIVEADSLAWELEQTLQWAAGRLPHAIVIVILQAGQHCDAGLVLSTGAHGVLHEPELDTALGPMCRLAAAGQVSVPASLRHAIQRPPLSHREQQTLGLAVAGLTNAQIARRLYIAETTVKTHLSSAFRRLGVHSRREAAALLTSDVVLRGTVLTTLRLSQEFPARGAPS